MIASCAPIPTGGAFLSGLLRSLDCHAVSVAERSFGFLGQPGSPAAAILAAALTLLIAIFGFRFMFGSRQNLGVTTSAVLKVGIALALASSWPAVTSVIARPVLQGPAELTAWIGVGANLPDRLAQADGGVAALTSWGTGRNDIRAPRTADGDYAANAVATISVADSIAFGAARVSYLLTAITSVGIIKLLAGLLIGLAPVFAGLLLFDRTRGIFAGWARGLFALLIAGAAVNLILALELSILEPWIAEVVRQRQASLATPSAPTELMAMTLAFGLICGAVILLIFRLCLSLEWPSVHPTTTQRADLPTQASDPSPMQTHRLMRQPLLPERVLQTAQGIERIEQYRGSIRQTSHAGTGLTTPPGKTVWQGDNKHPRAQARIGRATLIARKRDSRS